MKKHAFLSDDRVYRYSLVREWDAMGRSFIVIGLNPSTADENVDDPTIRRCMGFARREGCGRLIMLNLFAFRATKPKELFSAPDPVGRLNDETIRGVAGTGEGVAVAAWGAFRVGARADVVAEMFGALYCLGKTKDGNPRHPLYLPLGQPLELYRGVA